MSYQPVTQEMKKNRAVRLHSAFFRNCIFTAEMQDRPYPTPYPCGLCNQLHEYKTHHLNLDANGDVCVSEAVYQNLKDKGQLEGFTATREVMPLPTTINLGVQPQIGQFTVVSREHGTYGLPIIIAGQGETSPNPDGLLIPPQPKTPRVSGPITPEEVTNG